MVKRVVWTNTAKKARREILEYWIEHNGTNTYSKKLSRLFRIKAALLQTGRYLGKPTDFKDVRLSLVKPMAHKRKGQLSVSGEWAKHLRKYLRRQFWNGERKPGRN